MKKAIFVVVVCMLIIGGISSVMVFGYTQEAQNEKPYGQYPINPPNLNGYCHLIVKSDRMGLTGNGCGIIAQI